ncbi:hypothetical protein Hs30E_05640 [Lactococcus hodotermopsidis]|uniref:DUF4435 domain-containing protein n=1 Tax=Pseudolactococcus hodotermopsidis TaxID=2709157 RepID=A0A6A0BBG0_9LACT|nr:DUF4435 domain-containing protein [Lactococcus hodotermopsidis]GFH42013.1 hypothetical protein Hs30E_05640 [Lactococcus hodotermopsidis]
MNTKETLLSILSEIKEHIDKFQSQIKTDGIDWKNDDENKFHNQLEKFNRNYQDLIDVIENKKQFSNNIQNLFTNILRNFRFYHDSNEPLPEHYPNSSLNQLSSINDQLKQLRYLVPIDGEKNAVIIGGNGSGKSSLANFFKKGGSNGIAVIPARKNLFSSDVNYDHAMDRKSIQNELSRKDVKSDNLEERFFFQKLITALVNESDKDIQKAYYGQIKKDDDTDNIFFKFKTLYEKIIPDISFDKPDTILKQIIPIKNNQPYTIDQMSDGEKVIIYYIIQVLLAVPNATIIIDEPEMYLNTSIYNRLWNELEQLRADCRFIYISHRIDFIESRVDVDFIWCKGFIFPDNWTLDLLENESTNLFPKELLVELTGVKKDVIFCEGEKHSLDYAMYSVLFPNLTVIPVGNCLNVHRYVKAYNDQNSIFSNKAYGIIDNDLRTDDEQERLRNDFVFTTKFLEIEMMLCDEAIFKAVLSNNFPEPEISTKINEFKTKFQTLLSDKQDLIIQRRIKKIFEQTLSDRGYDTKIPLDQNIEELKSLFSVLSTEETKFKKKISDILETNNYESMLQICTLEHNEILGGIANSSIDANFENKAKNQLKENLALQNTIKNKYFSDFFDLSSE